jgi:hypothetical protein
MPASPAGVDDAIVRDPEPPHPATAMANSCHLTI